MSIGTITLLSAAAAGNGASQGLARGGKYGVIADGTFDGATVTIQVSPDGTNWVDEGYSVTADDYTVLELSAPYVRGVVTGGTSPAVDLTIHYAQI